jgi:hypothetical protein
MPHPSSALTTLRPELAGSLEEFDTAMDRNGFIGLRVLPVLEVAKASGQFGKIPIEQLLQSPETRRAPGSGYQRGKFTFTTDSYACEEHGWEEPVDDREAKLYNEYIDAEMIATERARDVVLRAHEKRVADLIFNTSTWAGAALTTSVGTAWSSHDDATPVDNVEAAILKVYQNTGLWPNALIINRLVYRHLRQCAQVIDRIAGQGAGNPTKAADITPAMLAQVFDLQEIIVAGSSRNTKNPGQDAVLEPIWSSSYAMVARIIRSRDIKEPGLGRTFHWSEDGSQIGGTIETYREEQSRSTIIRDRHDTDEKVLYTQCGHLLTGVAA